MIRRPPRSTRSDPLFPYTTLCRSNRQRVAVAGFSVGVGGSSLCPSLGELRHACVDLVGADIGGIEDAAIPLHHGRALGMARLGHGIVELLKSWGSADVFGWSTTFAIDKPWVIDAGICGYDLFDLDAMAPIVPEILGVGEAGNRSDERRVGKEYVSTCRYRWSQSH